MKPVLAMYFGMDANSLIHENITEWMDESMNESINQSMHFYYSSRLHMHNISLLDILLQLCNRHVEGVVVAVLCASAVRSPHPCKQTKH